MPTVALTLLKDSKEKSFFSVAMAQFLNKSFMRKGDSLIEIAQVEALLEATEESDILPVLSLLHSHGIESSVSFSYVFLNFLAYSLFSLLGFFTWGVNLTNHSIQLLAKIGKLNFIFYALSFISLKGIHYLLQNYYVFFIV